MLNFVINYEIFVPFLKNLINRKQEKKSFSKMPQIEQIQLKETLIYFFVLTKHHKS